MAGHLLCLSVESEVLQLGQHCTCTALECRNAVEYGLKFVLYPLYILHARVEGFMSM